jgi:hypothetical protein
MKTHLVGSAQKLQVSFSFFLKVFILGSHLLKCGSYEGREEAT